MRQELLEKKERIIYEDDIAIAALPENAATKGHVVIIPKKEAKYLEDLSEEYSEHLFYIANYTATLLFELIGAQGTNIITTEGKELYIEVIARKQDDGLDFQWKPQSMSSPDLDSITKAISGKILVPKSKQEEKPAHPPRMDEQKEEQGSEENKKPKPEFTDKEVNYFIDELNRIP
ncbi:MAG: HIT family protein [Nanoarchaeota archaeon]|nr:HIT family protein [Nanoarchaeota archaeon]